MGFSQGIPCPSWGDASGGSSAGADVVGAILAGLLGCSGHGPVGLDKANAPGPQPFSQPSSNITSSLNENGAPNQGGNQQQKQQLSPNGELDLSMLLGFYVGNGGGGKADFILSKSAFDGFVNEMKKGGRIKIKKGTPVPSVKGLYQIQVSAYGTPYENAVGTGTLYFNSTGIVGYSDYWNFDHKPSGGRSPWAEAKTRIGSAIPGSPFWVLYGIRPTDTNIPHD